MPTAVSAFAGVGGIDLAVSRAGWRVVAAIEINDPARGVLADRFPGVNLLSDITEVTGDDLLRSGFEPAGGLLAGGWPCQGHSNAGLRAGLDDHRSGLFGELARLAGELRPEWLLFENVPGLLSSRAGKDMGHVLETLAALGYGVAWRVLDARFFGVPQRRRRVIIVGHLGDWAGAGQILFDAAGGGGNPAQGRPAGPQAARTARRRAAAGSRAYGLSAAYPDTSGPLGCTQGGHRLDLDTSGAYVTVLGDVAHTLTSEGHDASEDGTGRGTPIVASSLGGHTHSIMSSHLTCSEDGTGRGVPIVGGTQLALPVALRGRKGGNQIEAGELGGPAYTLRASSGGSSQAMAAVGEPGGPLWVRRLTPLECERLQGFPDGSTATSWGKPQKDTPRYRQMGNAVAVPVLEWVARRMAAVAGVGAGGGGVS